jgi:hypothetical protein
MKKDNKIKLTAIYEGNALLEKYAKPFGKEISPYDFPDFTDKELVIKSKSENGEDEVLKFLSGDGKNIVAKLDFGLGEAVFKPYGTHDSLGGLLYYCRDISINGSNGLFICILFNGLNEVWIGVDKIFFEEYPYYFDDPEWNERCSNNWDDDDDDYYDDDEGYYDDDGNYIINPWRNDRGRIDIILDCEEFQILDMRNHDCAVVVYKNDRRVDIIPRKSIRNISGLEITQEEEKDIMIDILSVDEVDISSDNEFVCGESNYELYYTVEFCNRVYYVLENIDDNESDRLIIESGTPSGSRIVK